MSLWHLFIVNFEHILNIFVPFSNVSIDAFQQVNVCWAEAYSKPSQTFLSALSIVFNSFMTEVPIVWTVFLRKSSTKMMKCTKVLKCFESIKLPENGNQTTNICYL